jgi:hypothetical protein
MCALHLVSYCEVAERGLSEVRWKAVTLNMDGRGVFYVLPLSSIELVAIFYIHFIFFADGIMLKQTQNSCHTQIVL